MKPKKKTVTEAIDENDVIRSLVCVKLSVSAWDGVVAAPAVSKAAEERHGARSGTVHSTVAHLPDDVVKRLRSATHAARAAWNEQTLPWEDGGWRVVRADRFLQLIEHASESMQAVREVHDDISRRYTDIVAQARLDLNGLFVESAFPDRATLSSRFTVEVSSRPILSADQRVEGLDAAAQDLVERSVRQQLKDSLHGALQDIAKQLRELIADVAARIANDNQKGVRYGGMIKVIENVCASLTKLNIVDDPRIDALVKKTIDQLASLDPSALRDDADTRKKAMKACSEIEGDLSDLFGN